MDAKADESSPTVSPHRQRNVVPPQVWGREHPSGEAGDPNLLDPPSTAERQAAGALADTSARREAKIRELQEAVKSGTYHITAEQIADKLLRDMLRELRP